MINGTLDRRQVRALYEEHGRVLLAYAFTLLPDRSASEDVLHQRTVKGVRILQSIPELDQAAIDAVLQWQYEPPLLNGEPFAVESTVTLNFTLR